MDTYTTIPSLSTGYSIPWDQYCKAHSTEMALGVCFYDCWPHSHWEYAVNHIVNIILNIRKKIGGSVKNWHTKKYDRIASGRSYYFLNIHELQEVGAAYKKQRW